MKVAWKAFFMHESSENGCDFGHSTGRITRLKPKPLCITAYSHPSEDQFAAKEDELFNANESNNFIRLECASHGMLGTNPDESQI